MAAYLLKPVSQSVLLLTIAKVLQIPSGTAERKSLVTRHSIRESKKRLRILLAEDNLVNQKLATKLLEKMGHSVSVAEDGKKALEAMEQGGLRSGDDGCSDAGNGRIRSHEDHQKSRRGNRNACPHRGNDGTRDERRPRKVPRSLAWTVTFPNRSTCRNCMKRLTICFLMNKEDEEQEPYTERGEGIIHRDALLERVGGDMDLLRELVDLFMDDSLRLVDRISKAVTSKDADELEKAAHGLKGSVLNFGAKTSG